MYKQKIEIDPYNRLVLLASGRKSGLPRFRQVIEGRFSTDKDNNLTYKVRSPEDAGADVPHQISLKGEWSLTDKHELRFTVDKKGRKTLGDKITLRGEILDVRDNALLFAVSSRSKKDEPFTYVLELKGRWQADSRNRLNFRVKKEKGKHDVLIFKGAWDINKDHSIVYEYESARMVRKRKKLHTLVFRGKWQISGRYRLSYRLSKKSDSAFEFMTRAGVFTGRQIKYELGIRVSGAQKPVERKIRFSGRWKVTKGLGLVFEADYRGREPYSMVFGAEAHLKDTGRVSFKLRHYLDEQDMGVRVELSRELIGGDGEAFLRLFSRASEKSVYLGAGFKL
ncbi:MAG: hypothetical protein GF409_01600 [Candidatus Omnitrophica bacterium]|nr:hypothetical protein [Candidatus Omnitrophota bacterium]